MFGRFAFSLLIWATFGDAVIRWSFNGEGVLNATIGTPGQKVRLIFERDSFDADLEVPSTLIDGGIFNPNASSTFQKTGDLNNPFLGYLGITGTDTFTIGDGVVEKSEPFDIYENNWYLEGFGQLGLGHPVDGSVSFIQAVARGEGEAIVVLTYDQFPTDSNYEIRGNLTIGGKPDECNDDWVRVKEVEYDVLPDEQWAINISKIVAGKYMFQDPGQALISFNGNDFSLPETTSYQIEQAVGANPSGTIDCNAKTIITFTIGTLEIQIGPEIYVRQSSNNPNECYYNGRTAFGTDNYELPVSILRGKCLLLDYDKLELGFATRK